PQNYGGYVPPQSYPLQTGGPQNFQPYGTPLPSLGPHPAPVQCPECHARGVTAVEYSSGGFTHALAALVCFVSCLGCIPYLFSSLKDARHKCSKCGIPLATYHRSGRTEVHWHQAYNA
ncbi:LITAF-like zinc finger domain-containing protein, partial [Colletotrichum limetticola]